MFNTKKEKNSYVNMKEIKTNMQINNAGMKP